MSKLREMSAESTRPLDSLGTFIFGKQLTSLLVNVMLNSMGRVHGRNMIDMARLIFEWYT